MNAANDKFISAIVRLGIGRASHVFSKMVRSEASIVVEKVYESGVTEVSVLFFQDNNGVIASMIDISGDLEAKFLFWIGLEDVQVITDRILGRPLGTTTENDPMVCSAVQELGNILASSLCNVFSSYGGIRAIPSPPTVMTDFSASIWMEFLRAAAVEQDQIIMMETKFLVVDTEIRCAMFIMSSRENVKVLKKTVPL